SYNWSTTSTEIPPTKLLKFAVTVSWPFGGGRRSYQLDSLLSDRKFGIEKVNGVAKVDHAIRVFTTYLEPGVAGDRSVVTATGPTAASTVTSRLTALAEQSARGGEISLVREGTPTTAATPLINPALSGATSAYGAPPDQTSIPNPAAAAPAVVGKHPNLCQDPSLLVGSGCVLKQVGYLSDSHTVGMSVGTAEDRPNASGGALTNPATPSTFGLYVDAQRNPAKNPLQLLLDTSYSDPATIQNPTLNVRPNANVPDNTACIPQLKTPDEPDGTGSTALCRSMFASTSALTSPLAPAGSRKVETLAWTGFAELRIFPSSIIPGSEGASKPIVEITNFAARVNCSATGNSSTVSSSASWSATLRFRKELNDNNRETKGSYETVYLTSLNFGDKIKKLKQDNPMVYEVPEPGAVVALPQQGDAYLFPKTTAVGIHPSYLTDLAGTAGQTTRDSVGGASATAQIPGALTLTTGPADPDVPQSAMNITLGALSCSAADRRT
ncbi:MAG TPA: hypothetical protein VG929_10160, partial [Actinomycetota bacterium]|nr:hypothetical protein [Actinomycetota bacterium]